MWSMYVANLSLLQLLSSPLSPPLSPLLRDVIHKIPGLPPPYHKPHLHVLAQVSLIRIEIRFKGFM